MNVREHSTDSLRNIANTHTHAHTQFASYIQIK